MGEKTRYSEDELLEFKEIILQKLEKARNDYELLKELYRAKADEIEQIFSDGPSVDISVLADVLNKVAPNHSSKWRNITF